MFGNVVSFIGSYVSIGYRPEEDGRPMVPGGDLYPTLVRKHPVRPLRIFLQGGRNDLDNEHGNWFLANQQMLAALQWANAEADRRGDDGPRYQLAHAWGDGGHSDDHGGRLLPEVLPMVLLPEEPLPMDPPVVPPVLPPAPLPALEAVSNSSWETWPSPSASRSITLMPAVWAYCPLM